MTGTEIKARAEGLVDDTIDDAEVLAWINDGIAELYNDLSIETDCDITMTAGTYKYDLPIDFIELFNLDTNLSYKIWNGQLVFDTDPGDDTVTIYYYRKPTSLTALSGIPSDVPSNYHFALVLWICMRFKQYDEEFEQAAVYERQFHAKKALMADELKKKGSSSPVQAEEAW